MQIVQLAQCRLLLVNKKEPILIWDQKYWTEFRCNNKNFYVHSIENNEFYHVQCINIWILKTEFLISNSYRPTRYRDCQSAVCRRPLRHRVGLGVGHGLPAGQEPVRRKRGLHEAEDETHQVAPQDRSAESRCRIQGRRRPRRGEGVDIVLAVGQAERLHLQNPWHLRLWQRQRLDIFALPR